MKRLICVFISLTLLLCFFTACNSITNDESKEESDMSTSDVSTQSDNSGKESGTEIDRTWPTVNGDFIQMGAFANLSDNQLKTHIDGLVEAGIDILVLSPSGIANGELKFTELYYPSEIAGDQKAANYKNTYEGMTEKLLKLCEEAGIKCFISSVYDNEWFSYGINDAQKIRAYADFANIYSGEMYDMFKEKYPNAFYGWYFTPEFANYFANWTDSTFSLAHEIMNTMIDFYTETDGSMPFMMSPYFNNRNGCANAVDTAAAWDKFFAGIHWRAGDIFCPQDSVGANGLQIENFAEYFVELKKTVDKYDKLSLWSNPECFKQQNWTSAPITRYVSQLMRVSELVDGYISFAYSHYYSPTLKGNKAYHNDYLEYYNTGEIPRFGSLDTIEIESVEISSDINININITAKNSKSGVSYAEVYRDNVLIDTLHAEDEQIRSENSFSMLTNCGITDSENHSYKIVLVDFYGNRSEVSKDYKSNSDVSAISVGKAYTIEYDGNPNYPDDGKKLTDGKLAATASYSDPALSGFADVSNVVFVIDLGEAKNVSAVSLKCLANGDAGSYAPAAIKCSVSTDNLTYGDSKNVNSADFNTVEGFIEFICPVTGDGRYVKIDAGALSGWFFVDEITVFGN